MDAMETEQRDVFSWQRSSWPPSPFTSSLPLPLHKKMYNILFYIILDKKYKFTTKKNILYA